jgi:hypothetical protein
VNRGHEFRGFSLRQFGTSSAHPLLFLQRWVPSAMCGGGKVCALCALSALRGGIDGARDFGPGKKRKKCARRAVSAISHRCWFRWCQPATTVLSPCWSRCRKVRTKRIKRTNSGKRAGPAIGDSVVRKICAVSAVCVVRGCVSTLVILIKGLANCAVAV